MINKHSDAVVKSSDVIDVKVFNAAGDELGKIKEIVLGKVSGQAQYVVLSFGGIMGMGDKYFAVPWKSISYSPEHENFILNVSKEKLKDAPGFDKDHWPDMAQWSTTINDYYTS